MPHVHHATRDSPEEELRQTVARLQAEITTLRAQNADNVSQNNEATGARVSHQVQRVEAFYRAPKISPFFKADPALWFIQVEASLRNAGITNQITMADTVIAHLDIEAVALISDLVATPAPNNQYNIVKERIISTFAVSAEAKLRQLLKGQVTLDGKPSQILARMRNLSGSTCNDSVLRSIFLESLPEQCRAVVAASKSESLQDLAQLADTIMDAYGQSPQYSAISSAVVPSSGSASSQAIASSSTTSVLERLIEEIQKLSTQVRSRSRSRGRSDNSSPRQRSRSRSSDGLCRIHRKYGDKAKHCVKPCSWKAAGEKESN